MTPAAKASPAPVVLSICSRGSRTEPWRQVRPPGAAATQPAGKCTTASADTPCSIRLSAIAFSVGQSTGPSAVGTEASMPVSAPASSSLITMLSRWGRQGRATCAARSGARLTISILVCRPAAWARCSRADQPLPPPGCGRSMTGWMPGAPACRIRALAVPRSAVEASNRALAPLWWKKVRRPPSRSIIPSVNEVTAPASVRTPAVSMSSRAHSARMKAACSSSPTAPSTPIGNAAPSMRRSTAMLRPGPPVRLFQMSVVSFARMASVISPSAPRWASRSPLEAEVRTISSSPCATRACMSSRNSPRVRYRPGLAGAPAAGPAAVRPNAMSASLASAITKSSGVYRPAAMLLSLRSRRRTAGRETAATA
jgi:hypothetical protein